MSVGRWERNGSWRWGGCVRHVGAGAAGWQGGGDGLKAGRGRVRVGKKMGLRKLQEEVYVVNLRCPAGSYDEAGGSIWRGIRLNCPLRFEGTMSQVGCLSIYVSCGFKSEHARAKECTCCYICLLCLSCGLGGPV